MPDVDLLFIVPSRGRPHNIAALHDAWAATTTGVSGLLVAADDDDPALPGYEQVCGERGIELTVGPRLRMVPTLNKVAVEHAPHHFAVGFLGDDHRPRTLGFDAHYLAALRTLGTGWVYGNDLLAGERLPTQWAQTSDIVQVLGAMVPAPVKHLWADNQVYDLGHAVSRIRYLPDVVVEHCHPLAGKADDDARYREVNAADASEADRLVYAHWYEHDMPADIAKLRALIGEAA
ncbi:hypothetical protein AB0K34_13740 [Actinomadura sp. NPDC049382]|uniref:hypothetical protein n=1 Tax=Actinomadura sp. NPDC049382 TaxID=3158220 RepID=UPI00344670BA